MRLGDLDALKNIFEEHEDIRGDLDCDWRILINNAPTVEVPNYAMGYQDGVRKVLKEVAEGKHRPQGKWIGNAFDEHHCNRCGHPALWEEEPDNYYEVQSIFCPNCGAEMKGGKEE